MTTYLLLLSTLLLLISCGDDRYDHLAGGAIPENHAEGRGDHQLGGTVVSRGSATSATGGAAIDPPGRMARPEADRNENDSASSQPAEEKTIVQKKRLPRPLAYHRGVNLANLHRGNNGYGSSASARRHRRLRSIGVNAIAITPFGFQQGARSDHLVGFTGEGDDESRRRYRVETLRREVDSAHASGLQVMLKPHIWSHDFYDGEWHGTVRQETPEEHRRWWESYRRFTLHYAAFAQKHGVERFCIGTELVEMTTRYPEEWRELIGEVREVYGGELTYAAHWDREWREIAFWSDLDYIGIASYFPLKLPDDASVRQLVAAWEPIRDEIEGVSRKTGRPVLFLEAGYRPIAGPWREPWLYSGGTRDPEGQAQAFRGLFAAFEGADWFRGLYIWKVFTDSSGWGENEEEGFRFIGLPAERVIDSFYSGRR